jgi:hypothetical protein
VSKGWIFPSPANLDVIAGDVSADLDETSDLIDGMRSD